MDTISSFILGLDPLPLYGTMFGMGVFLHVSIFRLGEWDAVAAEIAMCFITLYAMVTTLSVYAHGTADGNARSAVIHASGLFLTLLAGLFASMVIYRSCFHRLHNFPGPFFARVSSAYPTSLSVRRFRYFDEVNRLHRKYGDFVRIGPNQLSIAHPSAVQAIHSNSSKCVKGVWYNQQLPAVSLVTTRDRRDHARRRKAWDNGLSFQALRSYEPSIVQCTQQLIANIEMSAANTLDISHQFTLYGFEVMGTLSFGKSLGMLEAQKLDPVLEFLHQTMKSVGLFSHATWCILLLQKIPGLSLAIQRLDQWADKQVEEQMINKSNNPNIFSWVIRDFRRLCNPSRQDRINLRADATAVVIAGSDTTANTLTCLLMELARHPEVYKAVQREVDLYLSENETGTNIFNGLEYLQACINESLRLYPLVPGGVQRQTPPQGLRIGDTLIPGNVIVQTPMFTLHTDVRSFVQPDQFIPERWTTRPELILDESPYSPFLTGRYSCAGKYLALMEMRHVVCQIASRYDIRFPDPQTPKIFLENLIDGFTLHCPNLEMEFVPRK